MFDVGTFITGIIFIFGLTIIGGAGAALYWVYGFWKDASQDIAAVDEWLSEGDRQ